MKVQSLKVEKSESRKVLKSLAFRLSTLRSSTHRKAGFTLIELLVVLAIFIIITSVVLAKQNQFSSDILLTDLAYKVAISIRQAQIYGLGVRGSANSFNIGYGIHLDKATPTSYKFFNDTNKNGVADPGASELGSPNVVTYQIEKGDRMSNVCGVTTNPLAYYCWKNTSPAISTLDIVYIRPNPSSVISSDQKPPVGSPVSGSYDQAIITIMSALGNRYKCIKIDRTGQVSVYNPNNPNQALMCK